LKRAAVAVFYGLMLARFLFPLSLLACLALPAPAANWPEWRGPDGQGHAEAAGYPQTWSEMLNVAWRTDIPGRGWSSPVIWGNQIWLTTALEIAASPQKEKARLKSNTGGQPLTLLDEVRLHAVCVDKSTGKILHNLELHRERDPQWAHKLNSYASPTPVIEEGRLYCHFGTFGTFCVDTAAAKILWKNTELKLMHENGPGSSIILWNNLAIFQGDGSDVQFVAALDKASGKVAWKTARSGEMDKNPQLKKSYATPLILEVAGKPVLFSPGANWLYGYDPADGRELWKVSYGTLGFSLSARPVAGHGMFFMSTGFMKPQMMGVKYEGMGTPEIAWTSTKSAPTMPSPLLVGDELYFVSDGGILVCLDAVTGAEHYRERLTNDTGNRMGGTYNASPIFADGRIYVFNREGVTHVIAPGKTFRKITDNKLSGQIMASPAAVDGAFFIRTDKGLVCIKAGRR
jgi:outer membrane protein assembly factor BamB